MVLLENAEKIWKQKIEEFMNRPHGMWACQLCIQIVSLFCSFRRCPVIITSERFYVCLC